jgi:hypothetical protein
MKNIFLLILTAVTNPKHINLRLPEIWLPLRPLGHFSALSHEKSYKGKSGLDGNEQVQCLPLAHC